MGKKNRKNKEAKQKFKTMKDRQNQIDFINQKLQEIQLDNRLPEIIELNRIMDLYIKTGESLTGRMPLSNSNKDICYILSNRANVDCQVNLMVR